tara:strand:+ start:1084 stop:1242 length:159 start_codon:yes stop_codon:yes gene_type:complete
LWTTLLGKAEKTIRRIKPVPNFISLKWLLELRVIETIKYGSKMQRKNALILL